MSGVLQINGYGIVILRGTSKEGKPYCFAKLDKNIANNPGFIKAAADAGALSIVDGKLVR
jgi:hypothetical protein